MGDWGPYTYGEPEMVIAEFERQGRREQAEVLRRRLVAGPRLRGANREEARSRALKRP